MCVYTHPCKVDFVYHDIGLSTDQHIELVSSLSAVGIICSLLLYFYIIDANL